MTVMTYTKELLEVPDTARPAFFRIGAAIARGEHRDANVLIRFVGGKLHAIKSFRQFATDMSLGDAKEIVENGYWETTHRDRLSEAQKIAKTHGIELEVK